MNIFLILNLIKIPVFGLFKKFHSDKLPKNFGKQINFGGKIFWGMLYSISFLYKTPIILRYNVSASIHHSKPIQQEVEMKMSLFC